jgi:hypothetical protein
VYTIGLTSVNLLLYLDVSVTSFEYVDGVSLHLVGVTEILVYCI